MSDANDVRASSKTDAVIHKQASPACPPNLADYDAVRAGFSWDAARARLDGLPDGGLNIAYEALDRHARGPRAGRTALRWLGLDGSRRALTYAELLSA
ncbi:MAG: hypothetical protein KDG55_24775, partial [Rhodocyclaceae bacterium]|nr:hypothetical protein [Rhodocyclaceae bacterium]